MVDLGRRLNRIIVRLRRKFGFSKVNLRGFMLSPFPNLPMDLQAAKDLGANLFRYQIHYHNWDHFITTVVPIIDSITHFCEHKKCKLVIDLHNPPGGDHVDLIDLHFSNPDQQKEIVAIWGFLSQRYGNNPYVWGYDLLNEPRYRIGSEKNGAMNLKDLYNSIISEIRKHDRRTNIIIEPPYGNPDLIRQAKIKRRRRIIYSVHMYYPARLTHQRIPGREAYNTPLPYPTEGIKKKNLHRHLKKCARFEEDHNTQIYLGEFSCIRWAPDNSSATYILDIIDIAERYGWPWTYHGWREYDGWDSEMSNVPGDLHRRVTEKTEIFKRFFSENKKIK